MRYNNYDFLITKIMESMSHYKISRHQYKVSQKQLKIEIVLYA